MAIRAPDGANNVYGQFARVNSVVTMVLGGAGICGNLLSVIVLSRPVIYFELFFLLLCLLAFFAFFCILFGIHLLSVIVLSRPGISICFSRYIFR